MNTDKMIEMAAGLIHCPAKGVGSAAANLLSELRNPNGVNWSAALSAAENIHIRASNNGGADDYDEDISALYDAVRAAWAA